MGLPDFPQGETVDLTERVAQALLRHEFPGDDRTEPPARFRSMALAVLADLDLRQIGWMDNFAEVHSEKTHALCDPDPPCVPVFCIHTPPSGRREAGP